jgi:hypothetical protein
VNLIAIFCIVSWRIFCMTMLDRADSKCTPIARADQDGQFYQRGIFSGAEGRDQRRLDPTHRKGWPPRHRRRADTERVVRRPGDQVARCPLDFYDAVARRLAGQGGAR